MIEARCLARRLRERLDAGWPVFDRATGRDPPGAPRRRRAAVPRHDRPLAVRVGPGRRGVRLPHDRRLGVLRAAGGPRRDQPAVGRGGPVRRDRPGRCAAQPVLRRQRRGAVPAGDDARGRRPDRRPLPARRDRRPVEPRPLAARRGRSSCSRDGDRTRTACRWRDWWRGSWTSRGSRGRWSASSWATASWPTRGRSSGWRATSTARAASRWRTSSRGCGPTWRTSRARSRRRRPTRPAPASG